MRRLLPLILAAGLVAVPATAAAAPLPLGGGLIEVTAAVETPDLFDDDAGGGADADDPAIWVNRRDRGASRVLATVKDAGLRVYNLATGRPGTT